MKPVRLLSVTLSQVNSLISSAIGTLSSTVGAIGSALTYHVENEDNPHSVTAAQVGLGSSDAVTFGRVASSGVVTVGATTTGAAAGSIYRNANTLRYRDSTNTERLLLNATDNLANLASAATARTNLGLGTTDSPTFAAITLGTSGILQGGTNQIFQRNGTNGQTFRVAKTWTSSTNFEAIDIDAASDASNYRIGSRIGSTGGTTRGLSFGSYNAAGTWTEAFGVSTGSSVRIAEVAASNGTVVMRTATSAGVPRISATLAASYNSAGGNSIWLTNSADNLTRVGLNRGDDGTIIIDQAGSFGWATSSGDVRTQSVGLGIDRVDANTVEVNNGTVGTRRDLALRHLTASGSQITLSGLPTSNPGVADRLWNDGGTLKIS